MVPAILCAPATGALVSKCGALLLSRPSGGLALAALQLRPARLGLEASPAVIQSNSLSLHVANHAFLLVVALLSVLAFLQWRRDVEGDGPE